MVSKTTFLWVLLIFLLAVLFAIDLSLGSINIPLGQILKILAGNPGIEPVWATIIWDFRMTKALTCVLAGSALALAGLQMQTLFRNPLAGPDVLGLTSGASLAVALIFMGNAAGLQLFTALNSWTVAIAASLGCAGVFLVMLVISRHLQDNVSLLIIGLMVGAGTSSIVSVLQYLSKAEEMQVYLLWTFGSRSHRIDPVANGKHILYADFLSEFGNAFKLSAEITKLYNVFLGGSIGFFEMTESSLGGILLFLFAKRELYSTIAVSILVLHLSDNAGTCLDHCTCDILTLWAEYASHSDFSSYNARHG